MLVGRVRRSCIDQIKENGGVATVASYQDVKKMALERDKMLIHHQQANVKLKY